MNSNPLTRLRLFIANSYSMEDFRLLCTDLGILYDDLGGDERISVKADRLLYLVGQQRRYGELLLALRETRPSAFEQGGFNEITAEALQEALPVYSGEQMAEPGQGRQPQSSSKTNLNWPVVLTPIAQFQTTYTRGRDTYDKSFSIEESNGNFLGECGVTILDTIGDDTPKNVSAFQIWLFEHNNIHMVEKVIVSDHLFSDLTIKARLAPKGEPLLARPGEVYVLETETLLINAEITEILYGKGTSPPESFFERITIKLSACKKEPSARQFTPIARFQTTYTHGNDTYDDSFSIQEANGNFLGECGVTISDTIDDDIPKNVSAFQIWLLDRNDVEIQTKVIMSNYSFLDFVVKNRVALKGKVLVAGLDQVVVLETNSLIIHAEIIEMVYGRNQIRDKISEILSKKAPVPPQSFFQRLTITLSVWEKLDRFYLIAGSL